MIAALIHALGPLLALSSGLGFIGIGGLALWLATDVVEDPHDPKELPEPLRTQLGYLAATGPKGGNTR